MQGDDLDKQGNQSLNVLADSEDCRSKNSQSCLEFLFLKYRLGGRGGRVEVPSVGVSCPINCMPLQRPWRSSLVLLRRVRRILAPLNNSYDGIEISEILARFSEESPARKRASRTAVKCGTTTPRRLRGCGAVRQRRKFRLLVGAYRGWRR